MATRPKKKTKAELDAEAKAAMVEHIRSTLVGWYAGKWAEEQNYGPACHCGLRGAKEPCTRHGDKREAGQDAVAPG